MDQSSPHTVATLVADLRALGLDAGDHVITHASARSVGYVAGGPQAIVEALLAVVGETGTLMVPTHTPDNTEPSRWRHPPVPEPWWAPIRAGNPGFDRRRSPSHWMGVVAETVRTWPGAVRSGHPHYSFAAVGARAAEITRVHRLDDGFGDDSPLGALYRLDGKVLLLGVSHDSNTSLHLAQWRAPNPTRGPQGGAIRHEDGSTEWLTWLDVTDEADLLRIGADFDATGQPRVGPVGSAPSRVMDQRAVVDFAGAWIAAH